MAWPHPSEWSVIAELALPTWLSILLAAAAAVTAAATLWTRLLRPGYLVMAGVEESLPVLREFVRVFRDSPNAFEVLDQMAAQFRTDGGSSLADVVNRLERAAVDNAKAVILTDTHGAVAVAELRAANQQIHHQMNTLLVASETDRVLADRDRHDLKTLLLMIDRLSIRVGAGVAVIDDIVPRPEGQ